MAPDLDVPTLVLHGSSDPEVPDEELQTLLSALPQAELVSLPGEGHMLPLTDGEFVAEQVSRWVRHVSAMEEVRPEAVTMDGDVLSGSDSGMG